MNHDVTSSFLKSKNISSNLTKSTDSNFILTNKLLEFSYNFSLGKVINTVYTIIAFFT